MTALPETILRAWGPGTQAALGGLMELAGVDPAEVFMSRGVKDHEWLGWRVEFPGVGTGKVIRCIIHPQGALMFDLEYDEPVSNVVDRGDRVDVPFKDRPDWQQTVHRYYGDEILQILSKMGGRVYPPA